MSKRSNQKRISTASRTLKFLREQAKLSFREASAASGASDSLINHLENGRLDIHQHHLDKLLPAYGATSQTYEMFASGAVTLPQNLHAECLEIVKGMSAEQLRTAFPVLLSLSSHK